MIGRLEQERTEDFEIRYPMGAEEHFGAQAQAGVAAPEDGRSPFKQRIMVAQSRNASHCMAPDFALRTLWLICLFVLMVMVSFHRTERFRARSLMVTQICMCLY